MQSLSQDERFFVQVDPSTVLPSHCDWDDVDLIYPNVAKTVQSILGSSHELNLDPGFDSVDGPKDLLIYEVLSQILPFPSAQSKFYWNLFCRSFASMLETANYPHRAQTIHLTYLFARVIGMMGSDVKPINLTMLTADGSTCEGSWVIPTDSSPKAGEVNRHVRLTIQPTDPRTGKFLRGSQVLDYLSSTVGSLGVVVVKDGYMDWRLEIEKFLFGSEDEDDSADECPPGTGFFLGLSLLPSGQIALKAYYQPCVAPKDTDTLPLTKSPVYITSKDFSPLSSVLHACHPTLVDQFSLMLEYIDTLEDRLKPQFHMFGFDVVAPLKNRIKIYFQTRTGSSWNDIVRNFTLGGRLNTPELHSNLARLEVLWNYLFPYAHSQSNSGNTGLVSPLVSQITNEDGTVIEHDEHPLNCLVWYYEFSPNSASLVPKLYFPSNYYCHNDLQIYQAIERFYNHPTVAVPGPPDGENGPGWVTREVEKAFNHRPLDQSSGITTWITFGHKHTGYELTTYYSPEIWLPRS